MDFYESHPTTQLPNYPAKDVLEVSSLYMVGTFL